MKKKYSNQNFYKEQYDTFNSETKKALRMAKQNYYKEAFLSKNQRTIWQHLNTMVTNSKKENSTTINYLNINGTEIRDTIEICEEINNYFVTVGENLASKIPQDKNIFKCQDTNPNSMYLDPEDINEKEIEDIINKLDFNKASGSDLIPVEIVKKLKNNLISILKFLIKLSIRTSTFPEKLKIAKVTPIFKDGHKFLCNNYRPISVLSVFSTIIERVIKGKIPFFF